MLPAGPAWCTAWGLRALHQRGLVVRRRDWQDLLAHARACTRAWRPFEAWDPTLRAWRPRPAQGRGSEVAGLAPGASRATDDGAAAGESW
eukprot:COSAG06_NODE_18304_length_894_cov_1.289308_1_plen_90_part_00